MTDTGSTADQPAAGAAPLTPRIMLFFDYA